MSLRWRIMGLVVLVVVLTAATNVGVAYFTTQARLGVFVDRIGEDEAIQLARHLSREYAAAGGWDSVEIVLSEAGYLYDGVLQRERSEAREEDHNEFFHRDPVRIVIIDPARRVVIDNFSELSPGSTAPELGGHRQSVVNLATNRPVGHLYMDVNREFLSTESHGFLNALLYVTLIGGVLTVSLAIVLAVWLSKRITAPVSALTEATQAIARGGSTQLPVTSSDELGRMSAAFNRMTSALASQRELRKRLIEDLSHELNTPLSVIQLEAKGLRDGFQSPESASDHIVQEVTRLHGLVTDLNALAESDYGELGLKLRAGSIYDLLIAELDRWKPQCQAKNIELSLQASPDMPKIAFDRVRMSQALGNVISNAIHGAGVGGNIVVKAWLEHKKELTISIVDDGIGINAEDLPHVLDRFYRADRSRSSGRGGTGLGLAITRAIVEAHGGAVTVASDGPGQGVTVSIRLPLDK